MQLSPTLIAQTRLPAAGHAPAIAARSTPGAPGATPFDGRSAELTSTYYDASEGRRGVDLLRSLHTISEDHHRPLSYDAARTALFTTVEDPNDTDVITDLYSGRRVPGVSDLASATAAGLTVEHVWPQSEGATEQARGDLHHLRPAFGILNSHRSNLPYGDVLDPTWASGAVEGVKELSLIGRDAEGRTVFTPRASMRGDLARDQFYFFTRYQADRPRDYSLDNFRVSLPTLLRWHHEDPVDDAERARNDTIAALQGNRNPYVDHPGYVDRVGFDEDLLGRRASAGPDRSSVDSISSTD